MSGVEQGSVRSTGEVATEGKQDVIIDNQTSGVVNLKDDRFAAVILPSNYITATVAPSSGNNSEGTVSFNFVDLF